MTSSILYRALTPADAEPYHTFRLRGLRECPTAFASSFEEEQSTPIAEIAARLAVRPDRAIFGAFDGDTLCGMAGVSRERMRKLSHKAVLWGMYVAPEWRRRGIGRSLVARVIACGAEMPGLLQIQLGVHAQNVPAIALYESLGFTRYGLERGCLLVDGVLHDEIHMVHVLGAG